jgi:hypothetical protein
MNKEQVALSLKSNSCQCKAYKKPGKCFCLECFFTLPEDLQKRLYRYDLPGASRTGADYTTTYNEALEVLRGQNE